MSAGPGRVQRRVLATLEKKPEKQISRAELEELMCGEGSISESNLLRAIRGLERMHEVHLRDVHDKSQATISLPPEDEPLPKTRVHELLAEIGGRG